MRKNQKKQSQIEINKSRLPVVQTNPYIKGVFYSKSFWSGHITEVFIIAILSFVLYQACIPYGYVLDDQMVITDNAFTKKGIGGIKEILTTESFTGYFGEQKNILVGNRYRPLSIVTFALEYEINGGLNPKLSHIINILLYFLSTLLLFQVLTLLFRNYTNKWKWTAIPFLASLFFIAHPIHTEAVANIKGRDEIMSMLFSLWALYASLRYMDFKKPLWLVLAIVSYFLALLSKENAITFLAVIPLSIYFFSEHQWKKMGVLMASLVLTTVAYLIMRFSTAGVPDFNQQVNDLMNNPFLGMTKAEKAGSILYTLGKYILLMVFPHPLSHDYYPYAIPKVTPLNLWAFLSLVFYLWIGYFAIKKWKAKSVVAYCILFYLATLSIVSNILINVGTFMNERFVFMASGAYCILIAYLISEQVPDFKRISSKWVSAAIAVVIVAGYYLKTILRVPDWENAISLNKSAVIASPNSARANSFMSTALFEEFKVTNDVNIKKNLLAEAGKYAAKAIEIVPDYGNANLMMVGVIAENFKMDYKIEPYIRDMKPLILRRPDISFIKEFSEWLNSRNTDRNELFNFYSDVGQELLQFNDFRRKWAQQYLEYAYKINSGNRKLLENLALAYEVNGNSNQAQTIRSALQNLN